MRSVEARTSLVWAWEFPLGSLRWSRKSQMPCKRGICEDRRSHNVRRDTPLPATGRPLSGTLFHAATSRLRVPRLVWDSAQVAVSRHAAPSKWGGRCRAQDHRVHSGKQVGSLSHDQAHRRIELCSQLGDAERRRGRERGSRCS